MFLRSKIFLKASLRLKLSWQECHGGPWRGPSGAQVTSQPDMIHGPRAERGRPSSHLRGQACSSTQPPKQRARMHFITEHDTQVMVTNGFSRRRGMGGGLREGGGNELGVGGGTYQGLPFLCIRELLSVYTTVDLSSSRSTNIYFS